MISIEYYPEMHANIIPSMIRQCREKGGMGQGFFKEHLKHKGTAQDVMLMSLEKLPINSRIRHD
jgi:hypothetical protein